MINDDDTTEEDGFDDFDDSGFEEEDSFDDFNDGKETTLADAIREKPIFKIGIVIGIIIILFIVFSFFSKGSDVDPSSVPKSSEVSVAPGTQDVPDNIRAAIEESDEQRRELAEQTGQSALPTLIEPPSRQLELETSDLDEEDPLQRWRALQQERLKKEQQDTSFIDQTAVDTSISDEDLRALADAMAAQMQAILENQNQPTYQSKQITSGNYLDILEQEELAAAEVLNRSTNNGSGGFGGQSAGADGEALREQRIAEIIIPAGEIEYAQLLLEANSDLPGPVLARISGGPLNGSRVLGSFSVVGAKLTLEFNTLVKDGISQSIQAIAISPSTSLPGLSTDVNPRYFTRIVLPAAAAFIEGTAEAFSQDSQTTINIQDGSTTSQSDSDLDIEEEIASGVEEAAQRVGELLDEKANNTQVLVRIRAGTPIGLLFVEPVLKEE